jgi:hypothetical protein
MCLMLRVEFPSWICVLTIVDKGFEIATRLYTQTSPSELHRHADERRSNPTLLVQIISVIALPQPSNYWCDRSPFAWNIA